MSEVDIQMEHNTRKSTSPYHQGAIHCSLGGVKNRENSSNIKDMH